ncbi:hypothetical protein KUTeg_023571 [Tegillarca granosa]|uniref:Uncharacterized protein n=1 Tax=Tegillarca granosa TaxID=220873 RepID=A0ABQ9E222_TEGGR|nr:hypothetical protein KUTeg_023571 [Tegillarca granosa]
MLSETLGSKLIQLKSTIVLRSKGDSPNKVFSSLCNRRSKRTRATPWISDHVRKMSRQSEEGD